MYLLGREIFVIQFMALFARASIQQRKLEDTAVFSLDRDLKTPQAWGCYCKHECVEHLFIYNTDYLYSLASLSCGFGRKLFVSVFLCKHVFGCWDLILIWSYNSRTKAKFDKLR